MYVYIYIYIRQPAFWADMYAWQVVCPGDTAAVEDCLDLLGFGSGWIWDIFLFQKEFGIWLVVTGT